ncbi:LOW QUALITY PROTEIN: integrin beta-PS-like [Homalodisca vitripennis]|uniref:LOW QUALITY PROTEIN: integrin beta-PS-like n=1 Tax=Homalodisca vitripennis TaxID=197043 RepID=UPI001EEBE3BB|nr:LOW QUALITY PROTEIN: integrin beta-PS-like [Homalodisca vitripennis]
MEVWLWWMLTLSVVCVSVYSQQTEKGTQNPCTVKQTCHDCIQTPTCAWCAQPTGFEDHNRCYQPSGNPRVECNASYIVDPSNEFRTIVQRKLSKGKYSASEYYANSTYTATSPSPSSSSSSSHHEAVQISPQRVSLKLRINEPFRITVDYAQAEDYPVDLYYLMDLSYSMRDDKEKLSSLGDVLAKRMQNITRNFRLGFGSFVDKVAMPYVSTAPIQLKKPCNQCESPYGFRNHMKLTTDTAKFNDEVHKAAISGNLDSPEGGFDAIMQAVVCREQIGWRERARRLLVFSTDAAFHYAGDGKLGGIVKPNDGLCHLDGEGTYTHSTLQDYPSIAQINHKVKQNAINVLFAVTSDQIEVYNRLGKHIEGSTSGTLSGDSSNVVDLVQEQYNKIKSSVEMKDTASNAVKVTYYSKCLDENGSLKQTNKCDGLQVGTVVTFQVEVEVMSCPKDPKEWNHVFQIYPVGINESLTVDLEMLCSCPCESPGNPLYKESAPECSDVGTYKCGVCECDSGHFGHKCECGSDNTQQPDKDIDLTAGCRPDNMTVNDCSGRGTCVCGQCDCDTRPNPEEKISGSFCECDNFSCNRHNGLLCSGPDHGQCVCGKCMCASGWTGSACDCRATNDTCIPPEGGEICSGRGVCECGMCVCDQDDEGKGYYSGSFCNKCSTCPNRCKEFKECVQCLVYKTGSITL